MTRSTTSGNSPTRPFAYAVGARHGPQPLVSPEQVKGHLRLLRMFYNLRITIEDCRDRRIPEYARQMDKDVRWRWFVHLAVERFERWTKSLQPVTPEKFVARHVPPVDVWMVWHAYMLNPCWYAEDCERLPMLQQLRSLNMLVVGSINISKVVQQKPSAARIDAWYRETRMPFNPFEAMTVSVNAFKVLECPRCRTKVYVPFINDSGTGFAQVFSIMCPLPGCRLKITHDNLAVAKFVRDLSELDGEQNFVAGSLFIPSGRRDSRHAKVIKKQLMQSEYFLRSGSRSLELNERLARLDRVKEIKENIGYSLNKLEEAISTSLKGRSTASVTRILCAYSNDSLFSIDLVDAVLRQCQFTMQMNELGWLTSGAFHEADKYEILEHSVMRYHAFLDLMSACPNTMLVPTLDIDLVWHTHQLMADRYHIDCEIYVGHHVDHELSVTESRLSSAFVGTCRAWQDRFQVPYMQCGCPVTDDSPSTKKLARLVRNYFSCRSQLQMVVLHPEHLPAAHPSTHNALLTFQTIVSGTFGKMHHVNSNSKQKEEKSWSPTADHDQTLKKTKHATQLYSEMIPPMHSQMVVPVYLENDLPAVLSQPSPAVRRRSDVRYPI